MLKGLRPGTGLEDHGDLTNRERRQAIYEAVVLEPALVEMCQQGNHDCLEVFRPYLQVPMAVEVEQVGHGAAAME